jgi:hypothetical protein
MDVTEDVDGTGAHLTIEGEGEHFRMTHDGLGRHDLEVKGRFVSPISTICPALLDENGELALVFHADIRVEAAAAVRISYDEGCDTSPRVLSGERFLRVRVDLEDKAGEPFGPANVTYHSPVDILIETEKVAEIEVPSGGFGSNGVAIVGESQLVRVSTEFGTLAMYEVVAPDDVDDWELQYWSEDNQHGIFQTDIESGMTYSTKEFRSNAVGVTARLLADGEALCSQTPYADFLVASSTTDVCTAITGDSMGHLATMLKPVGTCSFLLTYPAARGAQGLVSDFSFSMQEN